MLSFILSSTGGVISTDNSVCPRFKQWFLVSAFDFREHVPIYVYRNHFIISAYSRSSSFQILLSFFFLIVATYSVHIPDRVDLFGPFTHGIF